jgi:N-acetylglucosaminyldiphosphoundecaprenol N-acetyl-beta-D-mannosaminyltransferase
MAAVWTIAIPLADDYQHYFYGGRPGVADRLAEILKQRYAVRTVGTYAPPFRPLTPEEDSEIIEKINSTRPDIVWIGLGTSKEKFWAASHIGKLAAPVLIGVGAAFDYHAGAKRRPPRWVEESGLEWLFRLVHEPLRLGPRYLKDNPAFIYHIVRQFMSGTGREF